MNDRELLEYAAKAAGITAEQRFIAEVIWSGNGWNPLKDDGDALRLAVKLEMDILVKVTNAHGGLISSVVFPFKDDYDSVEFSYNTYDLDAIRRAIVRAAAEIGKAMPDA